VGTSFEVVFVRDLGSDVSVSWYDGSDNLVNSVSSSCSSSRCRVCKSCLEIPIFKICDIFYEEGCVVCRVRFWGGGGGASQKHATR